MFSLLVPKIRLHYTSRNHTCLYYKYQNHTCRHYIYKKITYLWFVGSANIITASLTLPFRSLIAIVLVGKIELLCVEGTICRGWNEGIACLESPECRAC